MRICRFSVDGNRGWGVIEGEVIREHAGSVFADHGPTGREFAVDAVRLLSPVAPPNVIAIGANYQEHINESDTPRPDRPLIFIKATTAVIGPGEAIVLPRIHPDEVDYEAELAVVIGRRTRHVSEEEALDCVLGYTCGNDVSQRLCQKTLDLQWARAKSFDTFCPLGPWIETDFDPADAAISGRLNGDTMQSSTTACMIFTIPFLISTISAAMTLLPGTVIMSGTPEGVGMARTPPRFLRDGDVYEVEIDGIGVLRNPVISESEETTLR